MISGMISVCHKIGYDIWHDICLCNIHLLYSLPVLLRESKDQAVRSLAMAVEELQMPWWAAFLTAMPRALSPWFYNVLIDGLCLFFWLLVTRWLVADVWRWSRRAPWAGPATPQDPAMISPARASIWISLMQRPAAALWRDFDWPT